MKKLLRVMKFGGTSVGDAACIQRVAKIVSDASREGPVVVVVSAMSGVTNRLIEAATRSEAGDHDQANARFAALRKQHQVALGTLIPSDEKRKKLSVAMEEIFIEGERLCKGTALLRELTPRTPRCGFPVSVSGSPRPWWRRRCARRASIANPWKQRS